RDLGGGRLAQALAAIAYASGGLALVFGSFFSMNPFEVLFWTALAWILLRTAREPRWWLGFGFVLGLAVMNKHTSAVFGLAAVAAVLASSERRQLLGRWPWVGAAIALLVVVPNLVWQEQHGWTSLEFYRSAQLLKNVPTSPPKAIVNQILAEGPQTFPIWAAGVVTTLRDPRRRVLGVTFAILFLMMIFSGSSRPDRIAGAYPMMMAAGAVAIERARKRWLAPAIFAELAIVGAPLALLVVPALPPAALVSYAKTLHVLPPVERGREQALPQWIADRLDWRELDADVEDVFAALPEEDRAHAVFFTPDYGRAGAIELFGHHEGRVVSTHNGWWLWSRGRADADVVVAVGFSRRDLERFFDDVTVAKTHRCALCTAWRQENEILVARGRHASIDAQWDALKHYE
ncbi:MAG TPA: glycosyltransferase family 39 protein, partial [Labilithrix sp.]